MSYPPYPEKFNTFYNTGFKQFWGSGFPYIKDDFVGGKSGLQYLSDDETEQKPVMDLQNVVMKARGKCCGGRKKRQRPSMKSEASDMEGEGADPALLRAVQKYRKDNKVSLKEAWAKVKEERAKPKMTKETIRRGNPPLTTPAEAPADAPAEAPKRKRGRPKKNVVEKEKPKKDNFTKSEVMKYKHERGISLKDAWRELRQGE
jgi:hypothetical protein